MKHARKSRQIPAYLDARNSANSKSIILSIFSASMLPSFKPKGLVPNPNELPSNVITGQFEVKILHYRNSKLVSQQINSINVSKSGISAEIYNIAQNYSTLYGIFAVFLAVLVGWGSNLIFRKV